MDLKETLKYIKLRESLISMVLGLVVILVSGVVLINYFTKKPSQSTPTLQIGDEGSTTQTQKTHVIEKGETLAAISAKYFGTSNFMEDIAAANGITNPDNIQEGQTIIIPELTQGVTETPTVAIAMATGTPKAEATESPSPTPVPTEPPAETATPTIEETEPSSTPTPTVFTESGEGAISTEVKTHTVTSNETLWKIAEDNYGSGYNWVDISEVNKLDNPNNLEVGQTLMIPNVNPKAITKDQAEISEKSPISGANYTVEKGDTLWDIAIRAYGDGYKWVEISRENNLSNPGLIHPGNNLRLPR